MPGKSLTMPKNLGDRSRLLLKHHQLRSRKYILTRRGIDVDPAVGVRSQTGEGNQGLILKRIFVKGHVWLDGGSMLG